jgi:AbrB family looped-hinge helix DNA binding protein
MPELAVKIGAGGRLVIPSESRAALGIGPGDTVILVVEADGLHMLAPEQAIRRAQALNAQHVGKARSLSEELQVERREEFNAP